MENFFVLFIEVQLLLLAGYLGVYFIYRITSSHDLKRAGSSQPSKHESPIYR
ncbi:MAG: hypothetical protein HYR76_09990 [Ignavibacteria bacterium]|nr:hypothetical protein [Ignavibacteria bacterium]